MHGLLDLAARCDLNLHNAQDALSALKPFASRVPMRVRMSGSHGIHIAAGAINLRMDESFGMQRGNATNTAGTGPIAEPEPAE
jgi:hypothetical protein